MIFLAGPRQIGKTTFAKNILKKLYPGGYYNWDNPFIRKKYANDPFFFLNDEKTGASFLAVFDEIHKRTRWKDILKGIYDSIDSSVRILVTGSARLELFKKSGDSLIGRYVNFHMLPITVAEILNRKIDDLWLCNADDWDIPNKSLIQRITMDTPPRDTRQIYEQLFKFGGFPEPLLRNSDRFLFKWQNDYLSLLLTEDLRDITNIKDIDTVEKVVDLLPSRIGSPLSITSLSRDEFNQYRIT